MTDPFARSFVGDALRLILAGSVAKGYRGELSLRSKNYPVQARADGHALRGSFRVGEQSFEFHAELRGDLMTLVSADREYRLRAKGGSAPTDPRSTRGRPARVLMVRHTLRDRGVRNMKSHTVLVPKGWTVEGGAWWARPEFFSVLPSRDIKIKAPDGREVHLGPSITAKDIQPPRQFGIPRPREGSADKGFPIVYMPTSLAGWKRWVETRGLPESYPGATNIRVVNAVVVPELTAILSRQIEPLRRQLWNRRGLDASLGIRNFMDAKVYAIELHYTHEGRDWEELAVFGTTFQSSESPLLGRSIFWSVDPSVSYRAPAGKLKASLPLLLSIANSLRVNPQWARMRAEHQAKLSHIALKGAIAASRAAAKRSQIIADANREIREMSTQGHRRREAIRDRTHRKLIHSIGETNDYSLPGGGGTVQPPSFYQNVYANGNGEYLLTNDLLYDPNTDPALNGSDWKTMRAGR